MEGPSGVYGSPLRSGRRWPAEVTPARWTPPPRGKGSTHPGRISFVWNVETPSRRRRPWSSYGPNSLRQQHRTELDTPRADNRAERDQLRTEHREQLADLRTLTHPAEQRAEEHRDRADRAEALLAEQQKGGA